jgi:hypothetical protein
MAKHSGPGVLGISFFSVMFLGLIGAAAARAQSDSASVSAVTSATAGNGEAPAPNALSTVTKDPAQTNIAQPAAAAANNAPDKLGSGNQSPAGATPSSESQLQKVGSEIKTEVKTVAIRLARLTIDQRRKWELAQAALPGFCKDWDRMLHDRELNNRSHLEWRQQQGYTVATFIGYGRVEACEAKETDEGVPIGKVTYQELTYYLAGMSIPDAEAHPKLLGATNTLEIFSWEKDRWFY